MHKKRISSQLFLQSPETSIFKMRHLVYIISIGILFFIGCTEPIDIELNDQDAQRLVVEAWLTDQPMAHEVKLSLTTSYFADEDPPKVENAVVMLNDGQNDIQLNHAGEGIYQTEDNFAGVPNTTYTLSIEWDGDVYEATSNLVPTMQIDSIAAEEYTGPFAEEDESVILLWAQENGETENYYLLKTYVNGELEGDSLRNWNWTDDFGFNGSYLPGIEVEFIVAEPGDTIGYEILSISEADYDFFWALLLETDFRGGPFDSPPSNLPTNFSNGALGLFSCNAVSRKEIVLE